MGNRQWEQAKSPLRLTSFDTSPGSPGEEIGLLAKKTAPSRSRLVGINQMQNEMNKSLAVLSSSADERQCTKPDQGCASRGWSDDEVVPVDLVPALPKVVRLKEDPREIFIAGR